MTLVYIAICPDCEWKNQTLELPPGGEEQTCVCCGQTFTPQWQAEEHEDLLILEQAETSAPEPAISTPAEYAPQTQPESEREKKVIAESTVAVATTPKQPETKPLTQMQGNILIMLLLIGLGMPFWGKIKPLQEWEYTINSGDSEDMDRMGRLGYELVSARWSRGIAGEWSYECIYKRPVRK